MSEVSNGVALGAGSNDEFQHLTDPYRRELLVHCYRLLGSFEDAEDALQETLLRAWRRSTSLEVQSSFRSWLYKIATNVSLDMIDRRKSRSMPTLTHTAADPHDPLLAPINDPIWLDPLPDVYLDGYVVNPEARYEAHESITLAFLTALQKLPGRQRAVLILRDVLGWKAEEVANLLDITVVAVNSALQRARATMKKWQSEGLLHAKDAVDATQTGTLLARYVRAWETADAASLIDLLREDAAWTMPPFPTWYQGRAAIRNFLDGFLFAGEAQGRFRLIATYANGCPAYAVYQRDDKGVFRPSGLQVVMIEHNQIAQIDDYLTQDDRLFSRFNLPLLG